ncbi:MAG TPA: tRNA preQ1(34) S-adenosylmethionine ribosyltransferase-isomerase QueA [Polyangiaceae bacterium]
MKIDLFDFELPPGSIAQRPAGRREDARLLVVDSEKSELRDAHVYDWPDLVAPGSLVVLNDTKVIHARLLGRKSTGGKVELLLVEKSESGDRPDVERWRALGKGLGELMGQTIAFESAAPAPALTALIEGPSSRQGLFEVALSAHAGSVAEAIDAHGHVPIPPYVRRADDAADRERYQTVFAREPGAVAAPTAGLHLSRALLDRLAERGVRTAEVTLHVGLGTFQPVAVDDLDDHPMHAEWMRVTAAVAAAIAAARERGAPVVAVGTTVVRALESAADPARPGYVVPTSRETRMLIQPGYDFRVVDALLTNFHVPRSTLLALVAAFAGRARILEAYRYAIGNGYRFYSYGDAMWLPRKARS